MERHIRFTPQRNREAIFRSKRQAVAKKVRQQHTHAPGRG